MQPLHLLYTECCPKCGSSNLKFQNIIHHFSCANVSPESSYNVGGMLHLSEVSQETAPHRC
ncbi:MAG: hypothetical protein ACLRYB_05330 [Segatella copri]